MKRAWILWGILGLFGTALVLFVLTQTLVPFYLRSEIIASLKKDCATCTAEMRSVSIDLIAHQITLHELHFVTGDPAATRVDLHFDEIVGHLSKEPLLRSQIKFSEIEVRSLIVTVTEGDLPSPRNHDPNPGENLRAAASRLGRITVSEGSLIYHRVHAGQTAPLRLKHIHGKIEVFPEDVQSNLAGLLENSGHFDISIKIPRTLSNIDLNVHLKVAQQNMVDLNPYFHASVGVLLKGSLSQGDSYLQIRNDHLTGNLIVRYLALSVDFEKTKDRSAFSAFASNFVKSFRIHTGNIGLKKVDQSKAIDLRRLPEEALLHFIFRGLGKAALEIVF